MTPAHKVRGGEQVVQSSGELATIGLSQERVDGKQAILCEHAQQHVFAAAGRVRIAANQPEHEGDRCDECVARAFGIPESRRTGQRESAGDNGVSDVPHEAIHDSGNEAPQLAS
jgi:hypothetical protein